MPIDALAFPPPANEVALPGNEKPGRLPTPVFSTVVAHAPLVSIDLIVENDRGEILLGLRKNPPAKGYWFVPGGRIRKSEKLDEAFSRLANEELGMSLERSSQQFLGVYEHFYDTDFSGMPHKTTHYVVLAYRVRIDELPSALPPQQHSDYQWIAEGRIPHLPEVHPNTQAYFATV